ncbi:hypothetical protein ACH5RR_037084 [Cinchona calisaya]|uniref:Uncharacterized protein n=1 Tax=Cinchona calisaya TaxID=153742 RepID=A0ABD2Y8W4_9GENT
MWCCGSSNLANLPDLATVLSMLITRNLWTGRCKFIFYGIRQHTSTAKRLIEQRLYELCVGRPFEASLQASNLRLLIQTSLPKRTTPMDPWQPQTRGKLSLNIDGSMHWPSYIHARVGNCPLKY